MGSNLYRRVLRILEKWPVDESKHGRDLGTHIRAQVTTFFPQGDLLSASAPRSPAQCQADLAALEDIVNNKAKHLYVRAESQTVGALGLTIEEVKTATSTEGLIEMGGLEGHEEGAQTALSRVTGIFKRRKEETLAQIEEKKS